MKLIIAGSRNATPGMIDYARRAVRRAHQLGWEILVGDAKGVDAAVIAESDLLGAKITVYGISQIPRHRTKIGEYIHVSTPSGNAKTKYTYRDEYIIAQADIGLFIWDGLSPGTKAGYEFARRQKIKAYLVQPKNDQKI